jgi:hypothetical protein
LNSRGLWRSWWIPKSNQARSGLMRFAAGWRREPSPARSSARPFWIRASLPTKQPRPPAGRPAGGRPRPASDLSACACNDTELSRFQAVNPAHPYTILEHFVPIIPPGPPQISPRGANTSPVCLRFGAAA